MILLFTVGFILHNGVCPIHEAVWSSSEASAEKLRGKTYPGDGSDCNQSKIKKKQSWNVERNRESAEQIELCIKYSNGDMALCRIHQE